MNIIIIVLPCTEVGFGAVPCVSRWETEAVEAAAVHNVATPHLLPIPLHPQLSQTIVARPQLSSSLLPPHQYLLPSPV